MDAIVLRDLAAKGVSIWVRDVFIRDASFYIELRITILSREAQKQY